ncbi:N-acetyltransferase family protein [Paenibacillus sp. 2TAB23]|uniref:GNAT family N-acetyltransferase n=1 Tax=Paenibacillus sp. 2TAB23 TaxID=3233004 RepID=UPI003F9E79DB
MNIRVLDEPDAVLYQALRLSALKCNPEAFGSTYEREVDFSLEIVTERLKPAGDKFVLGAFDDNGSLVGLVSFVRESGLKTAHKGNVYGMYVAPEQRGQGLGKLLMKDLISRASNCEGLEHINLNVISGNGCAKKLYQSLGFKEYGLESNSLKYKGEYFDECLMVLTV